MSHILSLAGKFSRKLCLQCMIACILAVYISSTPAAEKNILLIAGAVKPVDRTGHHDYLGGATLLRDLLQQTANIKAAVITDGWPSDESVFSSADCVVLYTDGGGKQAYLSSPERIAIINTLVARGAGIVQIHQAVDYPVEHLEQAQKWIGGVYSAQGSGRGHWDSHHSEFPAHQITHGVTAWKINDGWLNKLVFLANKKVLRQLSGHPKSTAVQVQAVMLPL